jgi:3-mercaptopyruvate sulfurtransferase SseA
MMQMMKLKSWWRGAGVLGLLLLWGCTTPAVDQTDGDPPSETRAAPEGSADSQPETKSKPESSVKPGEITGVDLQRLLDLQDAGTVLLVDVRPGLFYSMGHMPGAISLPKKKFDSEFPNKKAALDQAVAAGQVIVLYCTNVDCPDGYSVAKLLSPKGYPVTLYKGGWEEWKAMGFQ